jgi:hypothetical protein
MSRWFRAPLGHFLVLGGALFCLDAARRGPAVEPRPAEHVVVTAAEIRELRAEFTRTTGLPVGPADESALVRREADEELLYREARARGLDRGDRSVRYQLVEKMRFLTGHEDDAPGDEETLYRRAREIGLDHDDPVIRRMLIEKLRLLVKVEAGRDPLRTPGRPVGAEAERLLARLRAGELDAGSAARLGDAFPIAGDVRARSAVQVASGFGADFAAAVVAAPAGEWVGPVASAYGLHLVRVDEIVPAGAPASTALRARVERELRRERAAQRVAALVEELRRTTAVRVEGTGS